MPKISAEEANAKMLAIDKVIKKLDPAIRASAFEILVDYYFDSIDPEASAGARKQVKTKKAKIDQDDKETFFGAHDHDKPKDNVLLIVAWFYSQHGKFPITRRDVDDEAAEAGLTVPDRSDNTMRQAKHNGKNLFRQKNSGWELTVSGESHIKEEYGVKKGNNPRPTDDD